MMESKVLMRIHATGQLGQPVMQTFQVNFG